MLTRRMFDVRLIAALAATALPVPGRAEVPGGADRHWLNRLTFGANDVSLAEVQKLGRQGWLERQLAMPASDPGLEARLAAARLRIAYPAGKDQDGNSWQARDELRPLSSLSATPEALLPLLDYGPGKGIDYAERIRPAQEVIAASLIRAVHAPAQLREVLTQFWHDHFNVNSAKAETTAAFFPHYDAMLRAHTMGNFRALLGEVTRSAAMLYYLNNADSIASPANCWSCIRWGRATI